jgi:hypothetical protein
MSIIPLGITLVAAISYSWVKWRRRPEDSQSIAFVGLDRKRQWATYRSILRGNRIDDPVVLTIFESIHDHLRRSVAAVVATTVAIAVMARALVEASGADVSLWVPVAIVMLAGGAIAEPAGSSTEPVSSLIAAITEGHPSCLETAMSLLPAPSPSR